MIHADKKITAGRAAPLGAHFDGDGVNFAVFSQHAAQVFLCLFSEDGKTETHRLALPERDGDVWHGYVAGAQPGQLYGFRADGPYAPHAGHRFNVHKLLIDPYAKRLSGALIWHDALMGYRVGAPEVDLSFDTRDSARYMPKSIVEYDHYDWKDSRAPDTPMAETILYEAHVKGLTQLMPGAEPKGGFLAMASDPVLDHLTRLGVTAVELLPVHAFLDDRFLVKQGLKNYWGYQSLGFFAPDPRYLTHDALWEFQYMVARLHGAGIEVILDVVYNHSGEGTEAGPTLSFRGLDNRSYYRLVPDQARHYINDTGTGNTFNLDHPMVLRMVMDSLRYWVEVMRVDGFWFDLCATLGRTETGFDPGAAFFDAIRQDPVLTNVKLIAEPWDIGPGGYQVGAFPAPFHEWNDKYRDGVRRFWRGDTRMTPILADRITGSALQFDHSGRPATSSVNFVSAHDGFTLRDVTMYRNRHNWANGEENRDGHHENYSDNFGVEGATRDKRTLADRARRRRNMITTLLVSQGTPMLLAGDEIGNSQQGNNNAYAQDNEIGWVNWPDADWEFFSFCQRVIDFRKRHPILRQKRFLHSQERPADGLADLFWWRPDGEPMRDEDWHREPLDILCTEMRMASDTPSYAAREDAVFLIFNRGPSTKVTLPPVPKTRRWRLAIDTSKADAGDPNRVAPAVLKVPHDSLLALVLEEGGA